MDSHTDRNTHAHTLLLDHRQGSKKGSAQQNLKVLLNRTFFRTGVLFRMSMLAVVRSVSAALLLTATPLKTRMLVLSYSTMTKRSEKKGSAGAEPFLELGFCLA